MYTMDHSKFIVSNQKEESIESQPQNTELDRLYWLLWFIFSLSKDNLLFKLEIVDILLAD